jgi:hypothetical protein
MSRALQNLAGLILAAGLMAFAAFQFNAQAIRHDTINQEVIAHDRHHPKIRF